MDIVKNRSLCLAELHCLYEIGVLPTSHTVSDQRRTLRGLFGHGSESRYAADRTKIL